MDRYLLFQLYGPLAAWGDTAVGEMRPSQPHPGKSAVLGLLAAAFGIPRERETQLAALEAGYRLGVQIDHPGTVLRDYHTIQVPPRAALKGHPHRTRKDELTALADYQRRHGGAGTLLSFREYHCDSRALVALVANKSAPQDLQSCADALRRPGFTLYLGRKACPPALPLHPHIIEADNLLDAFAQARFPELPDTPALPMGVTRALYWENGIEPGISANQQIQTADRHDRLLSRARWQFAARREHRATLSREE